MSMEIMRFCKLYMRGGIDLPIRPSEMAVLDIICSVAGTHTPVSLAQRLGVSRPMITAHLNALIAAGMVVRVPSPEDGRSVYVMPTKCGMELVKKTNSENQHKQDLLKKKMSQKKYDAFIQLMALANRVLETE